MQCFCLYLARLNHAIMASYS
jgi:(p)ppGpp synthase/HD superfamily hydrolase